MSIIDKFGRVPHEIADDGEIAMTFAHFDMDSENGGLSMAPMSRLNFSLTDQAEVLCEVHLDDSHSGLTRPFLDLRDVIALLNGGVMVDEKLWP